MIKLLNIIKADAGYTPATPYERVMLNNAIAQGYVKGIGSETSDNYIALILTTEGKSYLCQNS